MSKNGEKKPRKNKKTYEMPKPLPKGTLLSAVLKTKWEIDTSIGKGGFGEIYSASKIVDSKKSKNDYVVKIEPHVNGPLFVEMNFYLRNAKEDDIKEFMNSKKLKHLGMPTCMAHGSHEHDGEKYRFLVMERFGKDLWSIYLENKSFSLKTVYQISIQMLDVLEYIHSKGFVHADIKGSNILLSLSNNKHVYLVDFGLASRYTTKEYKFDPRFAHNGTIEYTSRDAHNGVSTRRGDIEILLYNMIHWAGGKLPWENITDPKAVQNQKESSLEKVSIFLEKCFSKGNVPDEIAKLFKALLAMKYDTEPNYVSLRSIMLEGLKKNKGKLDEPLTFQTPNKRTPKRKSNNLDSPILPKVRKATSKKATTSKAAKSEETCDVNAEVENIETKPKTTGARKTVKKMVQEQQSDSETEASTSKTTVKKKTPAGRKAVNGKETNGHSESNGSSSTTTEAEPENETAEMKKMRQLIEERKLAKMKKTKSKK